MSYVIPGAPVKLVRVGVVVGATPVPRPQFGVHIYPGQEFVYIVHDDKNPDSGYVARTLGDKIKLQITNELFVPRRWYFRDDIGEWRVDQYSKISFWPEDLSFDWYQYFFSGMTPRQHELFNTTGFGWRDAKANAFMQFISRVLGIEVAGVRPDGVNIYNFLLTGGTLLEKAGNWRHWTLFKCQDTNEAPGWETYEENPAAVFKQGVCGHNSLKQSFYGSINQTQGDLFIPTACPGGVAAIETIYTRSIPALPWDAVVDGVPMRIVELCIQASEVFGFDGENWYYILEQRHTNGNQADFVLHVPEWPVLPIPFVRWQKQ